MSTIINRLTSFISLFHQRYEEYKRPRIPLNLLKSKEPETVKRDVVLPELNTPKPADENHLGEFFRP